MKLLYRIFVMLSNILEILNPMNISNVYET